MSNWNRGGTKVEAVYKWWAWLPHQKGLRAELRRCNDYRKAAYLEGYQLLVHKLEDLGEPLTSYERERLVALASLLAHVKNHVPKRSLPATMANPIEGKGVSKLRFRRLISHTDMASLWPSMQRCIKLLKGTLNVNELTLAVFHWNEQTRREWANRYFQALFPNSDKK